MNSINYIKLGVFLSLAVLGATCVERSTSAEVAQTGPDPNALAALGRTLFFDTNLSKNRTQSCASCHEPARAFTDGRDNGVAGAVSIGDDGTSLGDRNAPTTIYAFLSPTFHKDAEGHYVGGLFHNGRAATLNDQAVEPFTNPIELGFPNRAALVARIKENPEYATMFKQLFGESVFAATDKVLAAVADSIGAFERSKLFAPFDSKYDRYLRGEYQMTPQEALGQILFFSPLTHCTSCHLLHTSTLTAGETFTNYRYHNIGIPLNPTVRKKNGLGAAHRDLGLLEHPEIDDRSFAGKFKVPTLRNVAVTGPYMHNGVFKELRTAIMFYNQYMVRNFVSETNPETGEPWAKPEVAESVDVDLLRQGQPIDDGRANALIAFLETLTDRRYEALLKKPSRDQLRHSTIDPAYPNP